jgi:hypothetical protein
MEEEGRGGLSPDLQAEKQIVRKLSELCQQERPPCVKRMFVHVNLATRKFHEIWHDWWKGSIPPRLEVDMIPVFEAPDEPDEAFTAGVEVEFFKDKAKSFSDGLQQALSFGLFGFDSLVLWHIFAESLSSKEIESVTEAVGELVDGLQLPITYLATKLTSDFRFEFFAPSSLYSSSKVDLASVLSQMRSLCAKRRNPLLDRSEVEKRKGILKVVLRIPI